MRGRNRSSILFRFLTKAGEIGALILQTFKNIFTKSWEKKNFLQQIEEIGVKSLPIVTITAAFGGLVFGLQVYVAFTRYVGHGSEAYTGPIISLGLSKELIPVFIGLMLSGRVGASMAAEIGTMKITEQIDALFSLGADANRYLVVPRTLACMLILPMLTLYGDFVGILSGFFYNVVLMGVNRHIYITNTLTYLEMWDVTSGLIKAVFFGAIIAIVGCWQGLNTEAGAEGVGKATTRAAVISSVFILIFNFFLSKFLPGSVSV
jgi:phospholipid/cholesterol/gamma-HCH transport system permease protein